MKHIGTMLAKPSATLSWWTCSSSPKQPSNRSRILRYQ